MKSIKEVKIEEGMTTEQAIEKLLELSAVAAKQATIVTIPMKETGREEAFLVLDCNYVGYHLGVYVSMNVILASMGLTPNVIVNNDNKTDRMMVR